MDEVAVEEVPVSREGNLNLKVSRAAAAVVVVVVGESVRSMVGMEGEENWTWELAWAELLAGVSSANSQNSLRRRRSKTLAGMVEAGTGIAGTGGESWTWELAGVDPSAEGEGRTSSIIVLEIDYEGRSLELSFG